LEPTLTIKPPIMSLSTSKFKDNFSPKDFFS